VALILGEQKLPELIIAHLAARRADANNPMPLDAVLPLIAGPIKGTARATPSVEVWVSSFRLGNRRDDERYEINIDLYTDHANTSTTLTTELGWLAAIRRSFAGGPDAANDNLTDVVSNPFFAYLNGLNDAASDGWELITFYISGGEIITDDNRTLYRTTAQAMVETYTHTIGPVVV
jgi:hypothetical protein